MKRRQSFWILLIKSLFVLAFVTLAESRLAVAQNKMPDVRPLPVNENIERDLTRGETHGYYIHLKQGQIISMEIEEKSCDPKLFFYGTFNEQIITNYDFGSGYGREILTRKIEQEGQYVVAVTSSRSNLSGSYKMFVTLKNKATPADDEQIKAEQLLTDGFTKRETGQAKQLYEGIEKWNEALKIWERLDNKYWQAYVCNFLGMNHFLLNENQKALEFLNRSISLNKIIGNKNGQAEALSNIASIYFSKGDKQEALKFYDQALILTKNIGNKNEETLTLISMGGIYSLLGENQKALEFFNQALAINRMTGDISKEILILNSIGLIYSNLGESKKALDFYDLAFTLGKKYIAVSEMAMSLNGIGLIYLNLGENQKALESFDQALKLFRLMPNRNSEAKTLNNIGLIHSLLKDRQKALEYFNEALNLNRKFKDKIEEAVSLSNIGLIYFNSGESKKALDFYNQALILNKNIGNKSGEAIALNNIGLIYYSIGKYQDALKFFEKAVPLFVSIENKNGEASIFSNLMLIWNSRGNQQLAVFYGKRSVNKFQQLRGFARSPEIENAVQKSFLKTIDDPYKYLAELLIQQKDYETAIQVLNLYRDQQFFDFDKSPASPIEQVLLSRIERSLVERFESASRKINEISTRLNEMKRQIGNRQPDEKEKKSIEELESKLKLANDDFLKTFDDSEKELAGKPSDKNR